MHIFNIEVIYSLKQLTKGFRKNMIEVAHRKMSMWNFTGLTLYVSYIPKIILGSLLQDIIQSLVNGSICIDSKGLWNRAVKLLRKWYRCPNPVTKSWECIKRTNSTEFYIFHAICWVKTSPPSTAKLPTSALSFSRMLYNYQCSIFSLSSRSISKSFTDCIVCKKSITNVLGNGSFLSLPASHAT